MQKKDIITQ